MTLRTRKTKPTYEKWSVLVSDLVDQEIEKDGHPVFVWGLSFGGFITYMVVARNDNIKGLIARTLVDTREINKIITVSKNLVIGAGGYLLAKLLGQLLDPIKIPIRWLSPMELITNDPDLSKVFLKDKLAGGSLVKMRFLRNLMNAKPLIEPEKFNRCRFLVHPEIDPWTPIERSMFVYDNFPEPRKW